MPYSLPSRRNVRIAGQAAVLAILVGGSAAYAANDTTVQLTVDGGTREVRAFGTSVEDVLEAAGVEVGARDLVAPAVDAQIREGSEVVVQHARELEVTVDGEKKTYWTTALTVDDALADLGLRADGAWLSTSRSARLGRDGMAVSMLTPKDVRVMVDGETVNTTTTAFDVQALLTELEIVLSDTDYVTQPASMPVRDGMVVDVNRVVTKDVPEVLPVKAPAQERTTDDLFKGETKVAEQGKDGARTLVWRITTTDGAETAKTQVSDEVTTAAVPRVVLIGTKARPVPKPAPVIAAPAPKKAAPAPKKAAPVQVAPAPKKAAVAPARPAPVAPAPHVHPPAPPAPRAPAPAPAPAPPAPAPAPAPPAPPVADGSVWDRLAQCESGGNWSINTGNGYYGGLQFNLGTWQAYGGSGYPHQNSRADQIVVAERLRADRGFQPWPACSRKLGLR